jgi:hypothetical protein
MISERSGERSLSLYTFQEGKSTMINVTIRVGIRTRKGFISPLRADVLMHAGAWPITRPQIDMHPRIWVA